MDMDKIRIKVLESSTSPVLGGTSAELLPGEKMTITELLYGMMLPSGNDAAQTLGVYFGNYLL
jgi:D-alanyl-D-alanine carboxypeptidase